MDQQEVQQGTVASVTQGQHTGCIVSFKGTYRSCQWLLERALTLAHCVG